MITITLAPCPGLDKPFAAVTKETVALVGADVADGLQVALFDGSGTCLAVADVQDAQATLDLDTQEAVDATAPVGPGEAVSVWLVVGDKDTHIATVPCKLIRNLIDDESTHPHVPAERYPTLSELNAWLEAAGEVREGVCTCATAAASSAEAAASSARLASAQALNAVNAAKDASASAKAASVSAEQAASEGVAAAKSAQAAKASESAASASAAQAATQASGAARSATQANASAQSAASSATAASQSAAQAGRALEDAQTARGDAQAARDAAKASETAAAGSASAAAASATQAQEAKAGAEAAKSGAEAAKQGAEAAKAGAESAKTAAAAAATAAESSAGAAATSATKAEEAKDAVQAEAARIGYGFVAPGSPLVIIGGDGTCFTLVKLVDDMADQRATCLISRTLDGNHWFAIASTRNAAKNAYHCYILDDDLKPEWEFWSESPGSQNIPACVVVGELAFVKTQNRLMRVALDTDGTGTIEKQIVVGKPPNCARPHMAYNPKSGHFYLQAAGFGVARWDVYDFELNATGASFGQSQTSWFIFKGWLYGADETTLRRALDDDTMVDVAPTDGSPLKWNTPASELGGTGNARTWQAPIFAFRGKYEIYDGLYKYAVTFGEEGEMVIGPRSTFTTAMPIGFVGSFGFSPPGGNWTYVFGFVDNRAVAAMEPNLLNFSNSACFAFPGFCYSNPYSIQPLAFFDANLHSFRVMMRGAIMVNLVPSMRG